MAQGQNPLDPALSFRTRRSLASILPEDCVSEHSFGMVVGGVDVFFVEKNEKRLYFLFRAACHSAGIIFVDPDRVRSVGRAWHKRHSILPGCGKPPPDGSPCRCGRPGQGVDGLPRKFVKGQERQERTERHAPHPEQGVRQDGVSNNPSDVNSCTSIIPQLQTKGVSVWHTCF